jgi:dGTPase
MQELELWTYPGPEAQAAAIADDIAYDAHDLDDALRADMFPIEDLAGLPLVGELYRQLRARYPKVERSRVVNELTRRLIAAMVGDVVAESDRRITALNPWTAADIRSAKEPMIAFSAGIAEADRAIKEFLTPRMYRHERVIGIMDGAQRVVRELFEHYMRRPEDLPQDWGRGLGAATEAVRARRVSDFIAGMTDNFALSEHARFFDSTPDLR